jgi:hypothetical protein
MRIKEITCTNNNGDSLIISQTSVYKLEEEMDTTGAKANVTYSSNYRTHGATAVASRIEQRDLYLSFYIDVEGRKEDWIQDRRDEVFKVFNPYHNPINLVIKTDIRKVFIEANVELSPSIAPGVEKVNESWHDVLVQLSAGNPFFQDADRQKVEIATWIPNFEFSFEIPNEGVEMGIRSPSLIVNVLNRGHIPTGMIIQFKALGTLNNPSLLNLNTREYIKINKTMQAGEVITINTYQGKKRVEMNLNGVTTNIFNYLEFGSKFMQLEVGDNLFRYDSDTNLESLEVTIYFTQQYLGV